MIYKELGRTGLKVSRLGFGAMRLPELKTGGPDPEESVRIIHRAFELGVNYIDTAVLYCRHESQRIVGMALNGWRDKVYVSTKNHYYGPDERIWRRNLEDSLKRLDVDYIDIYNIHGINWKLYEQKLSAPNGVLSWMKKAKEEGLIRHICCSFHDTVEGLSKLAATDEFSSITLQYNFLFRDLEPVFPELAARNIGLVVMGPVGGGRLGIATDAIAEILPGAKSTPEAALRFVWANPNVTLAISGMSNMQQVEENCAAANREDSLSEAELNQIELTLARLKGLADLYCTGCNYCMPCPQGVNIPGTFLAVNQARVYGLTDAAKAMYRQNAGRASYCTACGACEPKCPQNIPIRAQLREAAQQFDDDYGKVTLALEPVRRDAQGVTLRARLHNVTDAPASARVQFAKSNNKPVEPETLIVEFTEPFQEVRRMITASLADGAAGPVALNVEIDGPSGCRTEAIPIAAVNCPRMETMQELRRRAQTLTPLAVNADGQVLIGKDKVPRPLGVRAWTAYNEERFLFHAHIKDFRIGNAAQSDDETRWNLDILVDVRDRERPLAPGLAEGVYALRATPIGDGKWDVLPIYGGIEQEQLVSVTEPGGDEMEVTVELPWSALKRDKPDAPPMTMPKYGIGFSMTAWFGFEFFPSYRAVWNAYDGKPCNTVTGVLFFE